MAIYRQGWFLNSFSSQAPWDLITQNKGRINNNLCASIRFSKGKLMILIGGVTNN